MNIVVDNYSSNKRLLSLFLVLIFIQPLQDVLAAEYKENEKPIDEIIEERKDPDESELMEEPEEAVTKDSIEEEVVSEEDCIVEAGLHMHIGGIGHQRGGRGSHP